MHFLKKCGHAFLLLSLIIGCGQKPTPTAGRPTGFQEFAEFWTHFRKAVLKKDWKTVTGMTVTPPETRGMMNDMPEIAYSRAEPETLFPLFMASPRGLNMENLNETHKEYIKANPEIKFREGRLPMKSSENKAPVAFVGFEKNQSGGKLVFPYLQKEVYSQTGKDIAL
jgi:hypothetical protein